LADKEQKMIGREVEEERMISREESNLTSFTEVTTLNASTH